MRSHHKMTINYVISIIYQAWFLHMTSAWQLLPQALLECIWPSHIPQFIRDTRHPWLDQNKRLLERLQDTEYALCSLDSPLRPVNGTGHGDDNDNNRVGDGMFYPSDLFSTLEIDNNRWEVVGRTGWGNARDRLREMLNCPAALQDVRELRIRIWVSDSRNHYGIKEQADPDPELVELFVQALTLMPNLTELDWETFGHGNQIFLDGFDNANLSLSSVKHLRPARMMAGLVRFCPNLEKLSSGGAITGSYFRWEVDSDCRMDLINSTRYAENLTHFGMHGEWEYKHIQAVFDVMPQITSLAIDGEFEHHWHRYGYSKPKPPRQIDIALSIIARFPTLKNLRLPPASELGLSWEGGAECGNVYFGPSGRAFGRYEARRMARATEKAANITLRKLPHLESLAIGSNCANLTRDEKGRLQATWKWTGRLKEWTYEMWPEEESFPGEDEYYKGMEKLTTDEDEDNNEYKDGDVVWVGGTGGEYNGEYEDDGWDEGEDEYDRDEDDAVAVDELHQYLAEFERQ